MRQFEVPIIYRSPLISKIKAARKASDKLKKDFSPTTFKAGNVSFYLARHFGFCYGVENAIEIAFKTINENEGKRIFLLSEMIHNPQVNNDLLSRGVQFLQDTYGNQIIPFSELTKDDIAIIPAFGTTLAIEAMLQEIGIQTERYNTTCPFVEKVWNRGEAIAQKGFTLIIHGKPTHEETRATFSHAAANAPAVIVKDLDDAKKLAAYIRQEKSQTEFEEEFKGRFSEGFLVNEHFKKTGVINQTTMLAEETQAIANYFKQVALDFYKANEANEKDYVADTRDTLCYATNDNQTAVKNLLNTNADLAIVVGGYKSSNTSHLVELCEEKLPTYYIETAAKIIDKQLIHHYHFRTQEETTTNNWLPNQDNLKVLITSGASCPDALVEEVMQLVSTLVNGSDFSWEDAVANYNI
jgi:4-hydroxy-3-methylbut-2-en-1-yl diphosphate reductase